MLIINRALEPDQQKPGEVGWNSEETGELAEVECNSGEKEKRMGARKFVEKTLKIKIYKFIS